MDTKLWVTSQLHKLEQPEALLPEINSYSRDWDAPEWKDSIKICLASSIPYSSMIANTGMSIIYDICNNRCSNIICERFYFPEPKLYDLMDDMGIPFFSKETFTPLKEFDAIGFSSHGPTHLLSIPESLEKSHIPIMTQDRTDKDPFIILGGINALSPEPLWDMVDAVGIGEAELMIPAMLYVLLEEKGKGKGWRSRTKERICTLLGWYIPEYYEEIYDGKKLIGRKTIKTGAPDTTTRSTINLDEIYPLTKMLIPNTSEHDTMVGSVVIAKGCLHKCNFCQLGFAQAPYRERKLDTIKKAFGETLKETGSKTSSLSACNFSDFARINELSTWLVENTDDHIMSASQRLDDFSKQFAGTANKEEVIRLGIEHGSERMRTIMNKDLTEEQILDTFRTIFELGFKQVLLFMISYLPFENEDDRYAIHPLMQKVAKIQEEMGADTYITLCWSVFQPKNLTPYQWAAQTKIDPITNMPVFDRGHKPLFANLEKLGIHPLVCTDQELAVINTCLTYGDRRMAPMIREMAHKENRCVFRIDRWYRKDIEADGDSLKSFQKIMRKHGFDYDDFICEKPLDTVFPWDFIDSGVTKEYLAENWRIAGELAENKDSKNMEPCDVKCTFCGCCTSDTVQSLRRHNRPVEKPIGFSSTARDPLKTKNSTTPITIDMSPPPKKINITESQHYLIYVHYYVPKDYRYVHNSRWKMHLRKAARKIHLCISGDIPLIYEQIKSKHWSFGRDYATMRLSKEPSLSSTEITEGLNKHLDMIKVIDVSVFADDVVKGIMVDSVQYIVEIPRQQISENNLLSFQRTHNGEASIENTQDTCIVTLNLHPQTNPHETLQRLFQTSKNFWAYPAERVLVNCSWEYVWS